MRLNMGFMAKVWGRPQTFNPPSGKGHYNGAGRWVPPEKTSITAVATILPLTSIDLQYYEGGTYTTEDVKVLVTGDVNLPIGTRFIKDEVTYEIREPRDYADISNLFRYVAKRLHTEKAADAHD